MLGARFTAIPMNIHSILSHDTPALEPGDTVGQALYRLADHDIDHLPVLDEEGALRTIVSEADLLDRFDVEGLVSEVAGLGPVFIGREAHWYEAASLLALHRLSALPVVDQNRHYLGLIRRSDLFDRFAGSLSTGSHGAVLVIEVPIRDFSLSQLIHHIEQSDARVLSLSTQGQEQRGNVDDQPVHVTLKLNTVETARVKHVLEHHGYHVRSAYNEELTDEDLSTRIAEFLRYLEV